MTFEWSDRSDAERPRYNRSRVHHPSTADYYRGRDYSNRDHTDYSRTRNRDHEYSSRRRNDSADGTRHTYDPYSPASGQKDPYRAPRPLHQGSSIRYAQRYDTELDNLYAPSAGPEEYFRGSLYDLDTLGPAPSSCRRPNPGGQHDYLPYGTNRERFYYEGDGVDSGRYYDDYPHQPSSRPIPYPDEPNGGDYHTTPHHPIITKASSKVSGKVPDHVLRQVPRGYEFSHSERTSESIAYIFEKDDQIGYSVVVPLRR